MNTYHGWIKLYRCLLDDAVCQKSAYFHLPVTLLFMAAYKKDESINFTAHRKSNRSARHLIVPLQRALRWPVFAHR